MKVHHRRDLESDEFGLGERARNSTSVAFHRVLILGRRVPVGLVSRGASKICAGFGFWGKIGLAGRDELRRYEGVVRGLVSASTWRFQYEDACGTWICFEIGGECRGRMGGGVVWIPFND